MFFLSLRSVVDVEICKHESPQCAIVHHVDSDTTGVSSPARKGTLPGLVHSNAREGPCYKNHQKKSTRVSQHQRANVEDQTVEATIKSKLEKGKERELTLSAKKEQKSNPESDRNENDIKSSYGQTPVTPTPKPTKEKLSKQGDSRRAGRRRAGQAVGKQGGSVRRSGPS